MDINGDGLISYTEFVETITAATHCPGLYAAVPRATLIDRSRHSKRDADANSEMGGPTVMVHDDPEGAADDDDDDDRLDICYEREEPSAEMLRFRTSRQPTQRSQAPNPNPDPNPNPNPNWSLSGSERALEREDRGYRKASFGRQEGGQEGCQEARHRHLHTHRALLSLSTHTTLRGGEAGAPGDSSSTQSQDKFFF